MTEIKNGVLDYLASGLTLRDVFACAAVQACNGAPLGFAPYAYQVADEMLAARERDNAEAERQKRLAGIGELAVADWLDTGDVALLSLELQTAIEDYVRDAKAADTLPSPPSDAANYDPMAAPIAEGDMNGPHGDVGLAVTVSEATRLVGASRNGDGA
jgi:hypothetical protein